MSYAAHAAKMDAGVDEHLGDSIMYKQAGTPTFIEIKGFVTTPNDDDGDYINTSIDEMPNKYRLKISRAVIATPHKLDRFTADLLPPGEWRMESRQAMVRGRYFLFDVAKAV